MTLSRTARILIGILLIAAAAFFWLNFFSREQNTPAPATTAKVPEAPTTAPKPAAPAGKTPATPSATSPTTSVGAEQAQAGNAKSTPEATTSGGNAPVVAPSKPAVATHDLQVAELPFLVTQPPQPSSAVAAAAGNGASSAATGQVAASAQRMTVNPFSPILVQAPPAPKAAPAPTPPPSQQVASQPAPQKRTLAQAPAPQPVAPPPPQASGLPGALPSGMLPTTPSVLQTARAVATSSAPKDLGSVAAVREPGNTGTSDLGNVGAAGAIAAGPTVPDVLGPGEAQTQPQPQATSAAANGNGQPPLQAGVDPLSRYLRDHNVRFTGTVLGPVSVGVFRSDQYTAPVVISLGQDLPETKITLTDLRGHEAVFSYQDSTQSLSLDLRR